MKTNDVGRALIEHFEGLRLEAFDQAQDEIDKLKAIGIDMF